MSKTSFFNSTLFFKNLKRFWPIWGSYLAIFFVIMPMVLLVESYNDFDETVYSMTMVGVVIGFAYAAICAMALYSYMYSSKSAGMFHALPMTRETMFITNYLSGLAYMFIPNLLVALISVSVGGMRGDLDILSLVIWICVVSGTEFFFFSFATFCAQFTGALVVLPVFYLIWNFVAYVLEMVVKTMGEIFIFGFRTTGSSSVSFLSPIIYMAENYGTRYIQETKQTVFDGAEITIWYVIAGAVFAILSLLLYRKRRVESAGDVVSIKKAKPVFRWCVAVCTALLLSLLVSAIFNIAIDETSLVFPVMTVTMLITGFIGWFAAEMLLKKSFRVFSKKSLGAFGIFAIVVVICMAATAFDLFNIENRIPNIEDVELITIDSTEFTTEEDMAAIMEYHQSLLDGKDELLEIDRNSEYNTYFSETDDNDYYYMHNAYIRYYMKNDNKYLRRSYYIPISPAEKANPGSYASRLNDLLYAPDKVIQRAFGDPLTEDRVSSVSFDFYTDDGIWNQTTVSGKDAWLLAQAVCADLVAGNMEAGMVFPADYDTYQNTITITYYPVDAEDVSDSYAVTHSIHEPASPSTEFVSHGVGFGLTTAAKHTLEALEQLGIIGNDGHQLTPNY